MLRTSLIAAAAALSLAACSTSPERSSDAAAGTPEDCFRNSLVSGFNVVDAHRVRLMQGTRHYIVTINQPTTEIDMSQAITVDSINDRICVGTPVGVALLNQGRRYPVSRIERDPASVDPVGS
jgi:hypothetical protein